MNCILIAACVLAALYASADGACNYLSCTTTTATCEAYTSSLACMKDALSGCDVPGLKTTINNAIAVATTTMNNIPGCGADAVTGSVVTFVLCLISTIIGSK
ncbi:uncharacterized protein LOC124140096 [Haliotis rufescens]|uniref:uncharacterized protein LOC125373467 n=1 Tax=Haliotis rufescens TaxID=6454 RepID=UPI001EAFF511|nr:uncharacterized protein LOC125373467 [Haliotis rufescens]XP_048240563.1 uncharacterized protein LOC124140096 [Haliotis rufescens]